MSARTRKPAPRRLESEWEYSPVGNEAENLRAAMGELITDLDVEMAAAAIHWIDLARSSWLRGDDWAALNRLGTAQMAFGAARYHGGPEAREELRAAVLSERGAAGATAMRSGNSKHAQELAKKREAKIGALALWKERHAGRHPGLRTVEQFATEVMRRWPILVSANVIRRWSAEWTRSARSGTEPTL